MTNYKQATGKLGEWTALAPTGPVLTSSSHVTRDVTNHVIYTITHMTYDVGNQNIYKTTSHGACDVISHVIYDIIGHAIFDVSSHTIYGILSRVIYDVISHMTNDFAGHAIYDVISVSSGARRGTCLSTSKECQVLRSCLRCTCHALHDRNVPAEETYEWGLFR